MDHHQIAALAIAGAMLGLFIWDRWRYDVVAGATLFAGVAAGVVKPAEAFVGFSNSVIIVIASVLVVSKAIARSGILDAAAAKLLRPAKSLSAQIGVLTASVAILSAFIKNVGTLGIVMPIAIKTARRTGNSPSLYLMPLAFASLIGGAMTLIGTSPNLLISALREKQSGAPFNLFDFAWVGAPLALISVIFLTFGWRLIPQGLTPGASEEQQFDVERYMTEIRVPENSPMVGKTVGDIEDLVEGNLIVTAIVRDGRRQNIPTRRRPVSAGDVLIIRGGPEIVRSALDRGDLELEGSGKLTQEDGKADPDLESLEAIVGADSPLIGETAQQLRLRHRYDVNLLAVSRAGRNIGDRLQSHAFAVGDIIVLEGFRGSLTTSLAEMGCLPLADRDLGFGKRQNGLIPLAALGVAIVAIMTHYVPVEVGFFGAAVVTVMTGQLSLKSAYGAIEGPVLVMLGCLISFAEGLKETGVTDIIGRQLAGMAVNLPPSLSVGLILLVTMW